MRLMNSKQVLERSHLPGWPEKNHEKSQEGKPVNLLRFKSHTSEYNSSALLLHQPVDYSLKYYKKVKFLVF